MASTPEVPKTESQITERLDEFPETIQQVQGAKPIAKTFKSQVVSDSGQPLIQTPPAQVITIQPPYTQTTLTSQAKGSKSFSLTWLSAFWLRMIKKAIHFGWKVVGK